MSEQEADSLAMEIDPNLVDQKGEINYKKFVRNMFP